MSVIAPLLLLVLGAWAGPTRSYEVRPEDGMWPTHGLTAEIRPEDICKSSYPEFRPLAGAYEIGIDDTTHDIVLKLGQGNPGGTRVLLDLIKTHGKVYGLELDDTWAFWHILALDTHGITGSKIWMLYKDVCHQRIACVHTVMISLQSGQVQSNTVYCAIENRGYGLNVNALFALIREKAPGFAPLGLDADYA